MNRFVALLALWFLTLDASSRKQDSWLGNEINWGPLILGYHILRYSAIRCYIQSFNLSLSDRISMHNQGRT